MRYDASSVAQRTPARVTATTRTVLVSWISAATSLGTPAWYATAPGVKLCSVVIGSLTVRRSVRKSPHAPTPARIVAATARMINVTAPIATARHRRVSVAHTSTSPGCILIAAPTAPVTPSQTGCSDQRHPSANRPNRIGPTWPSFTAYTNGNDQPARKTIHQRTVRDVGS